MFISVQFMAFIVILCLLVGVAIGIGSMVIASASDTKDESIEDAGRNQ